MSLGATTTNTQGDTEFRTIEKLLSAPEFKTDRILLRLLSKTGGEAIPEVDNLSDRELDLMIRRSSSSPALGKALVQLAEILIQKDQLHRLVDSMHRPGWPVHGLITLVEQNSLPVLDEVLKYADQKNGLYSLLWDPAFIFEETESKWRYTGNHSALICAVRMGHSAIVDKYLSACVKAPDINFLPSPSLLVQLFDTALMQKDFEVANRIWQVAQDIDTKATREEEFKNQLQKIFMSWDPPQGVQKDMMSYLASKTKILRHCFDRRLSGVIEEVIKLAEKEPAAMKALSDNFKADIKKNGPDPLHVFIHSAKRSALQDTQWAQRLDENVINPCKTLLRTYSDQTDPTDTSATGVL
jgi:hypothetical protein